jgi:hypothetical protein
MPRYRVREGEKLSHSAHVEVEGPSTYSTPAEIEARKGVPKLAKQRSYEGNLYEAGDELELPEAEGTRLVEAGELEETRMKSRSIIKK